MKCTALFLGVTLSLGLPSYVFAQDQAPTSTGPIMQNGTTDRNHGEVGIFADYFRFNPGGTVANFVGAGARVGFNVHNFGLEAEMNYDFARNYTSTYSNGATTDFFTSSVRPLTGLFGPKLQLGTKGPIRAFVTGKVGFVDFSRNPTTVVSTTTVGTAISNVAQGGSYFAAYPGGGVEGFIGWLGLRAEAGDEIYLDNGVNNDLRVTIGPVLRF